MRPNQSYLPQYSSIERLRECSRRRIPKFAFEYLDGGCNEDINLAKNTIEIRKVELKPFYLNNINSVSLKKKLFGVEYDAPFGVSPVGLQGLIWPRSPEILAKAAREHNLPFILSTVTTASIEKIGEITEGRAWFQLYHPSKDELTKDLLRRIFEMGYPVLVLIADVPVFGFRPRDIRNGLAMPPFINVKNMIQIFSRPKWLFSSILAGSPKFASLQPYIPRGYNIKQLGQFMNETFNGILTVEKVKRLREQWKGKLVVKGIATEEDTEKLVKIGVDGLIVSNHGGRQLDAGESSIVPMRRIAKKYGKKITIMLDSGIRSGPDIGRSLAVGAQFTFLGRTFMYGISALGKYGGNHTMGLLKTQLKQLLEQLRCAQIEDLPRHLKTDLHS